MGMTFENLTDEELCDLICGDPEEDYEEDEPKDNKNLLEGKISVK